MIYPDLWMMTSKQYMVDIHGEFSGDLGKTIINLTR
jgi:hypothetical protein